MSTLFAAILTSRRVVALSCAARGNVKTALRRLRIKHTFPEHRRSDDCRIGIRPINEQTRMQPFSHHAALCIASAQFLSQHQETDCKRAHGGPRRIIDG